MMTIHPPCPKCDEDELWLEPLGNSFKIRCYFCGWVSCIVHLADDAVMSDAIAATVAAAKRTGGDAAGV